jgi:FMN-dependent NADH-azoreductase
MSVLLHIDSSPLGSASISRYLSAQYVEAWKKANPGGQIITRDLNESPLTVIDAAWVGAAYTPLQARTEEQKQALALSDTLIAELRAADEYIIGLPMHNFTISAALKLWIDQIVRVDETFSYSTGAAVGLLKNKKAAFIVSSGAVYSEGSAMSSFDFTEPYLRKAFGFLGIEVTRVYAVGGVSAIRQGQVDRDDFLATHVAHIEADFQAA